MASSKTPARRYTETKVPILDSQLELKVLMQDAGDVGLSEPEWQAAGGRAFVLRFRIDGRPCQVVLRPDENEDDPDAELRRLHRVLLHFVTTAIEAARSRLLRVGEALLAWHVMTNGKMLGETVLSAGQAARPPRPRSRRRARRQDPAGASSPGPARRVPRREIVVGSSERPGGSVATRAAPARQREIAVGSSPRPGGSVATRAELEAVVGSAVMRAAPARRLQRQREIVVRSSQTPDDSTEMLAELVVGASQMLGGSVATVQRRSV